MAVSSKCLFALTINLFLRCHLSAQDVVATYYQPNLSEQEQRALIQKKLYLFSDSTFSYTIETDVAVSAAFLGQWRRVENAIYFERDESEFQLLDQFEIVEVKKRVEPSLPKNRKHIVVFDSKKRDFFTGMNVGIDSAFSVFWNEPIEIPDSESEIEFMFLNQTTRFTFAPGDKSNFYEFFLHFRPKSGYELLETLPFDRLEIHEEQLLFQGEVIFNKLKR